MPDAPISTTPTIGLGQWAEAANPGADALNDNWDLIDAAIATLQSNIDAIDLTAITDSIDALSDLLATLQSAFDDHSARHQNGGADEINVNGLSGLLADPQTPALHAASHSPAGSDPINVGVVWNFWGSLEGQEDPPWYTLRGSVEFTFADLDLDGLPVGSDVEITIQLNVAGVISVADTITISPGDADKYVSKVISIAGSAGDKVRPVITGLGSIDPGRDAAFRMFPV